MLSGHIYRHEESCQYLASTNSVVFLLHSLLDSGLVFICDEHESPPLFRLWILWKLNILNLQERRKCFLCKHFHTCLCLWRNAMVHQKTTSPKAPKYSSMTSFAVSGLRPPTKIFLTGSFFIAKALLGSITLPSSLCSFCASTFEQTAQKFFFKTRSCCVQYNHLLYNYFAFPLTFSTLAASLKRMKPKPLDRPEFWSIFMVQSVTSPNLLK